MAAPRVSVVEDEAALAEVLQFNLERAGFEVRVHHRGDEAWEAIRAHRPDLVLLDLMLPGMDGLELARLLKRDEGTSRIPVVMLTARTEEVDRIVGLELGADDYISKPFSPREVVLRVKAVLRRATAAAAPAEADGGRAAVLEAGEVRLDPEAHQVWVAGTELVLTPTEFRLLRLLLERQGRTQTRARLLSEVWGYAEDVDSRTVDTHVRRLRKKLGSAASQLETVVGVGYRIRK